MRKTVSPDDHHHHAPVARQQKRNMENLKKVKDQQEAKVTLELIANCEKAYTRIAESTDAESQFRLDLW